MALTPVEILHMTPGTGFFGYKRGPTDRLLAEIFTSFEDVWRERADLADKVEQLEHDLVRYRELEALLRTTLVSAERRARSRLTAVPYNWSMSAATTRLRLRVSPGSGRAEIGGRHGDAWKVRVTAPPEQGRANDAVVRLMADTFALPLSAVAIVSGHSARDKIVELTGVGPALIERRLASASSVDRGRKGRRS